MGDMYTLAPVSSRESLHMLGGLIQTRERLIELLTSVSDEDLNHQVQDFPTIGGYGLHLAQIEWWWNKMVLSGEGITEDERAHFHFTGKQEIPSMKLDKSLILSRLGEARMLTREYFHSLSDVEFRRSSLPIHGDDSGDLYSPSWVIYHLSYHESYHLGQMLLLRKWITGQREKWDHFKSPHLST
ncbi:DinB family protein [Paenalkalicoccus suaedae]|uniref:DinB family protein n=1 Tax=Paenalkalicoccus suaedae TaxID=2592382 RepID=A0A859FF24_9BACI|nr:DinB family protein [Paenalkalicoccus suaedae]QKS71779.1 DinB family protein [Paenalkalicoccus suaedae]